MASAEQLRPVVVSGPSGSGKSTLLKRLFQDYPNKFGFSVSHTTRSPRPNEKDGVHYHFVSREQFEELIKQNKFIEYTEFSNNLYGTSIGAVRAVADEGKCCILDIELQGVKSVKKTDLNARFLFVAPPSLQVLEERLRNRGTESEDAMQARLKAAKEELAYAAEEGAHDRVIVNDNLDIAYEQFRKFIVDCN
ncbi:putative guanylate kinase [Gigaspora rosea]|uniref:Guanylate kinase n=1 Tax=Gigaspora rosea TaxID=44941 RepID=A0A397UTL2_9GLOM|nr:putative guanylate kinase [Gigaspora rosea]